MDWLATNHTTIDCYKKCIMFKPEGEIEFIFQADNSKALTNLISTIKARKLLEKDFQRYLTHVKDTRIAFDKLQQILMARDFLIYFWMNYQNCNLRGKLS